MDWIFSGEGLYSPAGLIGLSIFLVDLIIRIVAIIVIPRNRKPTSAMAWLLAIYFVPFIGALVFLMIGNPRLPKARRKRQEQINEHLQEVMPQDPIVAVQDFPESFQSLIKLNNTLGALPMTSSNSAQLISDYEQSFAAMTEAVNNAKEYVHVEFYILQLDDATKHLFEAIANAAARGVAVRVLLDHWANRGKPFYKKTLKFLKESGVEWALMLPVQPLKRKWQRPDLRNHRKLLVVDNRVAFMGSQNVTHSSYNLPKNIRRGLNWVDLMAQIEGPVVQSIDAVFLSDWYSETGQPLTASWGELPIGHGSLDCQIVPSGPGFESENNLRLFLALIYSAQHQINMVSPYFIPDEAMLLAITTACQRGVRVELFVSEEGDQAMVYHAQRSYYEALLTAGVKIWMYTKPYILHSKSMTIDDDVAVMGSSNMDMRSFGLNMEISMLVHGSEFVQQLRGVEHEYRELSRELTLEEWNKQPLRSTILDNLARLTSALQ